MDLKDYRVIPGYEKFEINAAGEVRNVKTKRITQPYHSSEKTGPMVHLLDTKTRPGERIEGRLSVIKLVWELFGTRIKGWDLDPAEIKTKDNIEKKPRLTAAQKQKREDEKADKAVKAAAARAAKKAAKETKTANKKVISEAVSSKKSTSNEIKITPITQEIPAVTTEAAPSNIELVL